MSTHHATAEHTRPTALTRRLPAVVRPGPVPLATGELVEYAQLDHAASTPALESVTRAVETVTRTYSSVHRGTGWLSRVTSAHYEAAREEVARFVGAREDDVVVFTRTTTDATNLLARALPEATPVVVFAAEHHASLLPWPAGRTHRLPVPASPEEALGRLESCLAGLAGGPTPLVVVTGASNVTGELWPVGQVVAVARRHGARVLLDAAQLVAHRPVDLGALGADWVALSGHKLHAPFGAGALVGRRDWLDAADPYLAGGGASASVTDTATTWAEGSARHEGGSPNVVGAVALAAACAALREHRSAVEEHEARLAARLLGGLAALPGVRVALGVRPGPRPRPRRRLHRRRPRQRARRRRARGRARDRRAGRPVLRPPARRRPARAGGDGRHGGGAGQRGHRDDRGARRAARRGRRRARRPRAAGGVAARPGPGVAARGGRAGARRRPALVTRRAAAVRGGLSDGRGAAPAAGRP